MAKKGKKSGFRLPKEIGGVKVPKEARRAGEALIEKANSPAGRQALASGLAMAATVAAAAAARQNRHAEPAAKPDPACGAPGTGGTDASRVADAIGEAANAFMSRIFNHK